MTNWREGKEVWIVITLVSFAGILAACSTYKASLTLRPTQKELTGEPAASSIFGDKEAAIAQEIAAQIAQKYQMRTVPGPYDPRFTEPYQVLSMFRGAGSNRHVILSAAVKDDRSEIAFVITDQEHGSETEFTSALWRSLEQETNKQLAGYAVAEEKSSTLRNPLAP